MATRRERVILDLEDHLSPGMVKAAAATGLLNKELGSLSRDSVRTRRSVSDIDRPIQSLGRSSNSTGREVDRLSGRMRILADVATILGPSLIPIGAVAVPAVAGLAAQLGFAAIAGGTAVLAFHGIGDALKALNDYQLEPTEAHLRTLQEQMSAIGPAGRRFVRELQDLRPVLQQLQNVAQREMFPGVIAGLQAMERVLPKVELIVAAVASEVGKIAKDTGESLASDRWTPFLDFLAREAPSALADMADAAGNTIHALAELWMAFDPVNDDFSNWLVKATEDLDKWAAGLSKTEGFHEFVEYIETNGPQVADTFGAIANAVIQIVEAASPLGGPVLKGVEALADLVGNIADSDLGTPLFTAVAALALFNRTIAITQGIQGKTFGGPAIGQIKGYGASIRGLSADLALLNRQSAITRMPGKGFIGPLTEAQTALGRVKASAAGLGKAAGLIGGITVASTGAADKIGLTNTASLALAGTIAGPWGAAIGGGIGLMLDAKSAASGFGEAIGDVDDVIKSGTLDQLQQKLAELQKQRDDLSHTSGVGDFFGDSVTKFLGRGKYGNSATDRLDYQIGRVQDAMNGAADAAADAVPVTDAYGRVIKNAGGTARTTEAQIRGMVDAMRAQREEALSAFSAETRYRQALKDAQKQAKESNAGIRGSSDEALKNRQAIEQLAAAWNNQSDAVKNNETKFKAAKQAFIDTAIAMGVPEEAARRLARRLLEIPEKRVTHMQFDAQAAIREINRIKRMLSEIPPTKKTDYYVNQINSFNKPKAPSLDRGPDSADGGTVPGQRWPYGDKVYIKAAPGEEIITNRHGEADRFRADRAAGRIPAYADGGRVGGAAAAYAAGQAIDYDRLATAVSGNQLLAQRIGRDMLTAAFETALQKMPVLRVPDDPSLLYGAS